MHICRNTKVDIQSITRFTLREDILHFHVESGTMAGKSHSILILVGASLPEG